MARFTHVIKRSGVEVPFTPNRISNAIYRAAVAVGGRDKDKSEKIAGEVIQYLEQTIPENEIPHVEQIQDATEKILIENGHAKVAKAYILYRDERARMRKARVEQSIRQSSNIPWAKIWQVLDWAASHDLHTTAHYEERLKRGELQQIVSESEMFYEEDIKVAAREICERRADLRIDRKSVV